jgi:hypothetical protein
LDIVQKKTNIVSKDLVDIYTDVLALADAIKDANSQKGDRILQKMHQTVQHIHELEEEERKNNSPEDILKNI